jgi:hypothetical protein
MDLQYSRIDDLMTLIKDSFRVRPNEDPVYVDGEGGRGRARRRGGVAGARGVSPGALRKVSSNSGAEL